MFWSFWRTNQRLITVSSLPCVYSALSIVAAHRRMGFPTHWVGRKSENGQCSIWSESDFSPWLSHTENSFSGGSSIPSNHGRGVRESIYQRQFYCSSSKVWVPVSKFVYLFIVLFVSSLAISLFDPVSVLSSLIVEERGFATWKWIFCFPKSWRDG